MWATSQSEDFGRWEQTAIGSLTYLEWFPTDPKVAGGISHLDLKTREKWYQLFQFISSIGFRVARDKILTTLVLEGARQEENKKLGQVRSERGSSMGPVRDMNLRGRLARQGTNLVAGAAVAQMSIVGRRFCGRRFRKVRSVAGTALSEDT